MFPSNPLCRGTGQGCRDVELTPGQASGAVRISVLRSSSSVCASLCLGTGESRVGRRIAAKSKRVFVIDELPCLTLQQGCLWVSVWKTMQPGPADYQLDRCLSRSRGL
ncbi:hypothetical protein INR49_012314 [Caranx melampygus]|nr:hypothetical protein INR49_012314 [Caranx melampygus]